MKSILLLLLTVISCATVKNEPEVYIDEYGIIHRKTVTTSEIAQVLVIADDIQTGCKRLRDIVVQGTSGVFWKLKEETAKQGGTHVTFEYAHQVNETIGYPWDCKHAHTYRNNLEMKKSMMRQAAMTELEKRRRMRGQNIELRQATEDELKHPSGLPLKKYNPYK